MNARRALIFWLLSLLCLTACEAEMSLSYNLSTGDAVTVTLDVEDGTYLFPENSCFVVKRDGQTLLTGRFVQFEDYFDYILSFEELEVYEIIPEDDTPTYYFFEEILEDGFHFTFLTQVEDQSTGAVVTASGISIEEAEDTFLHLHFTAFH